MDSNSYLSAEWKHIQHKTFTKWVNLHLKTANRSIDSLQSDLSDGLNLLALLEVLSGKKMDRFHVKPRIQAQKLENLEKAMTFIVEEEKIILVNIGVGDILQNNTKLILGLIWTLILHYDLAKHLVDDTDGGGKPPPVKERLRKWIQEKIPTQQFENFTTDWNDGQVLAALVDAIAPGVFPDRDQWHSDVTLHNVTKVMDTAEQKLGVPQLISPEDLCNPHVDELSMMTYLVQFVSAEVVPSAMKTQTK